MNWLQSALRPFYFECRYLWHTSGLRRVDTGPIPGGAGEIRLFAVVRNEALRIPWFLDYYSKLGVDRFFFVDNDSTDGTRELLAGRDNVHVFRTSGSYKWSNYGCYWREKLFRRFAEHHWCLAVDADEMFIYPGYERMGLPDLCRSLEKEGSLGMSCTWVQMYSDRPVRKTVWTDSSNPLKLCPFFDRDSSEKGPHPKKLGWQYNLSKAPLFFRSSDGPFVWIGQHSFTWPSEPRESRRRGAVLHFKYTADLYERCEEERRRKQHWRSKDKYGGFFDAILQDADMDLMHSESVMFGGSSQLIDFGIMRV